MKKNETQKLKKTKQIKWLSFAGILFLLMIIPFVWNYMSANIISALYQRSVSQKFKIIETPQKEDNLVEQPQSEERVGEAKDNFVIGETDISGLGPAEAYLIIRKEFSKIRNINDLIIFTEAYGNDDNIAHARQLHALIDIVGEEIIMSMIISAQGNKIKSTEIISSSKDNTEIKIISNEGREGRAIMVYERGAWRLKSEYW